MIDDTIIKIIISKAFEVRKNAYAPYSRFAVGAAILAENGEIFTGCNVENASYPVGNCAERTALTKAVSEGKTRFKAIAVVGGEEAADALELTHFCSPCGMCRQLLSEFCDRDFCVIIAKSVTNYKLMKLGELLPAAFMT